MSNVYQNLQQARVSLQDMNLKKTGKNQSFNYYELRDFLPAVNALCHKLGLMTQFNIVTDRGTEKAVLTVYNALEPQEKIAFTTPTAESQLPKGQPIQNLGSKITYLRRYLLMTAFEIVESDMVDSVNQNINDDLSEEDVKAISEAKTEQQLKVVAGELKARYKMSVINPHYEQRLIEIKQEAHDNS